MIKGLDELDNAKKTMSFIVIFYTSVSGCCQI